MYDMVMVMVCYVHREKGFKLISFTINSLSGTLHIYRHILLHVVCTALISNVRVGNVGLVRKKFYLN